MIKDPFLSMIRAILWTMFVLGALFLALAMFTMEAVKILAATCIFFGGGILALMMKEDEQ